MTALLRLTSCSLALIALGACGNGETSEELAAGDGRQVLIESCETSRGIGWSKREYGENYCACWADKAREILADANYARLVNAAGAELRAADEADREEIVRQNTTLYSSVSSATRRCDSTP